MQGAGVLLLWLLVPGKAAAPCLRSQLTHPAVRLTPPPPPPPHSELGSVRARAWRA
eukprot:COSAG01_NODE_245_length_20483_cov_32.975314_16_plen_56_part_00